MNDAVDRRQPIDTKILQKPRWRERTSPGRRRVGVAATFALDVVIGAAGLVFLGVVLAKVGAGAGGVFALWAVFTAVALGWSLRTTTAATLHDDTMSWTEFVVRYGLVGFEQPRSELHRALMTALFGAPLVVFAIIGLVLTLGGLFP